MVSLYHFCCWKRGMFAWILTFAQWQLWSFWVKRAHMLLWRPLTSWSNLFRRKRAQQWFSLIFCHNCLSDLFTTSEWCSCAFRWLCPSVKRRTLWVTLAQRSPTAMLNIHSFLPALMKCQTCVKRNAEHVTWWSGALFSTWMMGTAWGRHTAGCGGQRLTLLWWTRIPQCMRQAILWKNTAKRQGAQRLLFSQVNQ